jgi:alpha-L-fucosidase
VKQTTALQEEFLKLKFGMFLHYNMATYVGKEWVAGYPDPSTFDPGGTVDTDAWADAAVAAGMTYGVLTAKHVGGFCLWDSQYTDYGVMHPDCPYKQDLVAQFVKSFTSRGLKAGLYYCWRSPGFDDGDNKGKFKVLPPECDPATHSFEEQIEFQKKQIRELVERYPEVFYIWNDGLDPTIMPAADAQAFVRSLGPDVIASGNWWDWGKKGSPYLDLVISEKTHLPEDNVAPGETCWVLEDGWFWHEGTTTNDTRKIFDHLTKANSRNANLLLNVGPDRAGRFSAASLQALGEIRELLESAD